MSTKHPTENDYERARQFLIGDDGTLECTAMLVAVVRAEERERCAAKCDELGGLYVPDSHAQRTCWALAVVIRSGE